MGGKFQQPGTGTGAASTAAGSGLPLFDHERLEVYRVAREYLVVATALSAHKMPRDLRDQFDRASTSILFNLG